MIPIPEKGESIYYYAPTMAYHLDRIPNDQLQEYMPAVFIGKAFDDDASDECCEEAEAIFGKTIDAIKSGDLKADYIDGFDPDLIRPDWEEFEIGYGDMKWFMYLHIEPICIVNVNGHIEIRSNDFRASLYHKKWYFMYVDDNPVDQSVFLILMDIDAESATIDDIAKIMLDTLPKQHPDIDEFF